MNLDTRREAHRAQSNREELAERIAQTIRENGRSEPLKGLHLNRVSSPTSVLHSVSQPGFCVIAQGSKEIFLNRERYRYDRDHFLLVTAELPLVSHIVEASQACPYLSLRLELDPTLVGTMLAEVGQRASQNYAEARAIHVSALDTNLLEAVVRCVRLLDSPDEAEFLRPMIMREIIYRLLMGEHGSRLRHIAIQGAHTHRITQAIEQLRKGFDQPLRIDDIARELGMSVSSFHHHFKAVTAMSPLQFQKRLQMQEARRLMLSEAFDAAHAAHQVGYGDASQFNREYKMLFGLPPRRDVERLRETGHPMVL